MQRLAQVVARRSQKARLGEIGELQLLRSLLDLALQRGMGLLQSRRHVVELIAQRLKLVAGLDIDPVIEGAGPDPGCAGFAAPGSVLISLRARNRLASTARMRPPINTIPVAISDA